MYACVYVCALRARTTWSKSAEPDQGRRLRAAKNEKPLLHVSLRIHAEITDSSRSLSVLYYRDPIHLSEPAAYIVRLAGGVLFFARARTAFQLGRPTNLDIDSHAYYRSIITS